MKSIPVLFLAGAREKSLLTFGQGWMLHVVSHPEADAELEAAALYYEQCCPGLGSDFLDDFEATLVLILDAPERWRKIRGKNRKRNFRQFPYAIVYEKKTEQIVIKACMDLRRRPFYWKHRG